MAILREQANQTVKPEPSIMQEITHLSTDINQLHKSICQLKDRISHVLRPTLEPVQEKVEKEELAPISPIYWEVITLQRMVQQCNNILREMIETCEL